MELFNIGDYILIAIIVIAAVFIMMWRKKRSNI